MFIAQELRELSEISSSHFPDKSGKWLLRQREHLEALLRIVASEIVDAFDFGRIKQLNRSFISDELRTQESDMVFSVPFRSPTETRQEVIVYLLIEHQSTVDPSMGLRLLSYMVQIWMEERRQAQEKQQKAEDQQPQGAPQDAVAGDPDHPDRVLHRDPTLAGTDLFDHTHGHP